MGLIFGVLGRLQVAGEDGRPVPLAAARQRALLAALLLNPNHAVPAETLVELVWDGAPPRDGANTLRTYVMRLRRTLGPALAARVETRDPGYLIRIGSGELDTAEWDALYARAGSAVARGDTWRAAAEQTAEALRLWRESPLLDVPSRLLRDRWLPRLEQQHLQLREWRIEAEIRLGNGDPVIPEIRALVAEHPLREPLHHLLMLALSRANRTGEALAVYRDLRATLIEQLGIEPGSELTELHRQLLAGEAGPARTRGGAHTGADRGPDTGGVSARPDAPRQLPNDIRTFVGRDGELAAIAELAEAAGAQSCATVLISAIDGMGGVGKSALAVHAAHRISPRFPDGQLFADLRGHTAGLDPLGAEEALGWFLRTLGIAPERIPEGLAERAALYRSRLAGTRTLIVLDNAAGAAQARPLIPAAPGCLVLITSRAVLSSLDDAHFVHLAPLDSAEAGALLCTMAGPGRVAPDAPAVADLVELCGRLPLALRIAGSYLLHRRGVGVEEYVAELRDAADRLDLIRDEERDLTALFDTSYAELLADEQRLFRLLSLVPGTDFDVYAAANLLDADPHTAERLLESLLARNLVTQRVAGRYAFHSLLRGYARGVSARESAWAQDLAAWHRLMAYYAQGARAAENASRAEPTYMVRPPAVPAAAADALLVPLPDLAAAVAWLRTERANLLAAVADAQARPAPEHVIELTNALAGMVKREGPYPLAARLHADAAAAAQALGLPLQAAYHLLALGDVQRKQSSLDEAFASVQRAVELYRTAGDRGGEAAALHYLGINRQARGDVAQAAAFYERSLALSRETGDHLVQASVLLTLGRMKQHTGDVDQSLALKEQALESFRAAGNANGVAGALWELGRLRARLGDLPAAAQLYRQSMDAHRALGGAFNLAHGLWELGRVHLVTGETAQARELFEQALRIFEGQSYAFGRTYLTWELGRVRFAEGEPEQALRWYRTALAGFRASANAHGEANVLHELGRARHALGGRATAALHLERALRLFREVEDPQGQAEVLNARGAHAASDGAFDAALAYHRQALELARGSGSPLDEARALDGIARCQVGLGDVRRGLTHLREAAALYTRITAVEGRDAGERLDRLERSGK